MILLAVGTLSGCSLFSDSPEDTLRSFAENLQKGDVAAVAGLTDDPPAARAAIQSMFDGMGSKPKLSVSADLVDDKQVTGTLEHRWQIRDDTVEYQTDATLVDSGSGWRIRWQPAVLHRQLRDGRRSHTATTAPIAPRFSTSTDSR